VLLDDAMLRTYQYRLKPKEKTFRKLQRQLELSKNLYNAILEKTEEKYNADKSFKVAKKSLNNILNEIYESNPEYKGLYSQVAQDIFVRIQKSYRNFFRKLKNKEKNPGFPRQKTYYKSITYPQNNGAFTIKGSKLHVSKIGTIKMRMHRPISGEIKTMTIKRDRINRFFVFFVAECEQETKEKGSKGAIGIDMGLNSLIATSDGVLVKNPRFLKRSEEKLKRRQKTLSKRDKGSKNRRKARYKVAKLHERIANQRKDFMHKLTTELASKYEMFAVEDLQIKNMLNNRSLSKSISDASWGMFLKLLSCKAESANLKVVTVNPDNTSRICSNCGNIKEISLSERIYNCEKCGLSIDRDINAANNILHKATTVGHTGSKACEDGIKGISSMNQELISSADAPEGSPRL